MTLRPLALGLALIVPGFARAGWDNVFQVTCCNKRPVASYSVPVPAPTCCAPQAVTNYVQRSYSVPETTLQAVTNYEPVTSYRTSYYYEAVPSVSYSMYVDPCTGCQSQVATPSTSYRLRTQANAVTNYVARISYRPVTSYRTAFYMEPVTTYYTPGGAPLVVAPAAPAPVVVAPAPAPGTVPQSPVLNEQSSPANPTQEPPPNNPAVNNRSLPLRGEPRSAPIASPTPAVRYDRMTSGGSGLSGQVVSSAYTARPGAVLQLVSATGERQSATADAAGRFQVPLAPGTWTLTVDGQYHSKVEVRPREPRVVTVVSR